MRVCVGRRLGGEDGDEDGGGGKDSGGGERGTQHQPQSRLMAGSNSALAQNAIARSQRVATR